MHMHGFASCEYTSAPTTIVMRLIPLPAWKAFLCSRASCLPFSILHISMETHVAIAELCQLLVEKLPNNSEFNNFAGVLGIRWQQMHE